MMIPVRLSCLLAVLGAASCSTMRHENIDQDIPSAIVADYATSTEDYVDEGVLWIPFVFSAFGEVAKVEDGFAASSQASLGPLGLLVSAREEAATDAQGRVQRYHRDHATLWGFLTRRENFEDRRTGRRSSSFKIAFGLLGHGEDSNGRQTFYFLWIPIPISDADPAAPGRTTEPLPENARDDL